MSPSRMTTMRSAKVIASSWSWVTKMKVFFSSWCSRSHSARSSRRSLASRLDSGSSSRKVDGFVTRVRASATRCDSPPEQAPGNLSRRPVSRTISATSRTRRARSSRGTFFMRSPNSMFCATVLCGNSAWVWNTMPRPRSRGSRSLTTLPSMRISPWSGSSNPAIRRNVVVLPQPDGPTNTTNSPSSMMQLRSRTATICP